ncbi:MAG: ATPase [Candidatus Moranbacteria bacterium RIFCSPLOWO2_02_FULL_48_19]|nr:MAG: ATPase [Candidatus Moranbacteria bacterium RIFCSPLOWO2_02_FULL_48_19]OGI30595.1 MAG: ATPase [Candidatus Moranbacteria bacterium RIFCSPLOWO2_12_FULL_48_12]
MNKNELIGILEDWNFWKKDLKVGLNRSSYLNILEGRLPSEQIKVIIGARRSGKSYIMRQLAKWLIEKKGVNKNNILIINFEDPRFTGLDTKLLQQALDVYLETYKPEGEIYVFLDEVQEIPRWEKWVRTMQELGKANIIVSGSNSKLLSSELATVLTGRHLDMTVMPLSFAEFLKFKNLEITNELECIRNEIVLKSFLKEFLEFGSFPLVVLGQDKESILLSYFDDVVNKDLIKRYKIRKTEEIKSLVKFYLSNVSSPVTFTSVGKFLNISTVSAERFSAYLETSYVVFFLKRFSFKVKQQEKSPRKVYAVDTGLANVVGFRFSDNFGKLAENMVFLELKRRSNFDPSMEIYYWKSLAQEEVNFVVKRNTNVTELIQVCWDIQDINTKKRETKVLLKAMYEFKLDSGLIITEDFEGEDNFGGKKIRYVILKKWLLGL